jgi:hypothetical protein
MLTNEVMFFRSACCLSPLGFYFSPLNDQFSKVIAKSSSLGLAYGGIHRRDGKKQIEDPVSR